MKLATLADLLLRNAQYNGSRPAITDGHRSFTHRDHALRAWRLADALAARGVQKGDRVAVLAQNRFEYLEFYSACEAAGFILTTLNWRLAPAELAAIVADCTPTVLAFEAQYRETVAALGFAGLRVVIGASDAPSDDYEALLASGRPQAPTSTPSPDDIAYLVYTSGTTGDAKGVMLSHRALLTSARTIACQSGERPTDRLLMVMPLFHIGARIEWLAVQAMGGATSVLAQFDPLRVFATIARDRATIAHLAPVMVKRLVEHPQRTQFDLGALQSIHYGSAPVPVDELRRAVAAFGSIFTQLYGMTEHLVSSILLPHQQVLDGDPRDTARLASAGQPYPGTEVRIADERGEALPLGTSGEILVRSEGMMTGYWNRPALTADVLRDGWLATGDVGRLDEDHYLFIVDRKKDMIISGGENIYSREVEDALLAHPAVLEVAVIGVPDAAWGESVHAIVVLRDGLTADQSALIEHCRARIASYKKPRAIEFMSALPRLAHGKVDKKALRAPYWTNRSRGIG